MPFLRNLNEVKIEIYISVKCKYVDEEVKMMAEVGK